jgi:hypothetical protein
MPKGGSKPGERRRGRRKGTPNKATIEKALIAARTVGEAKTSGKKLAQEVLEDLMHTFVSMAEHYKPTPPEAEQQNPHADESMFVQYAKHVIDCAKSLAPYQSPTFRAVVVAPSPDPNQSKKIMRIRLKIFDHDGRELSNGDGREIPEMLPPDEERQH